VTPASLSGAFLKDKYMKLNSLLSNPLKIGIALSFALVGCADLNFDPSNLNSMVNTGGKLFKSASNLASSLDEIGEEEEYYIGRAVAAQILTRYTPLNNESANAYVQKVGMVVAGASSRPETYGGYHFQILNSDEVNAFATPGGFVFITKGFLKLLPDEDALAAVLAHEVSHVILRHGLDSVDLSKATEALKEIGKEVSAQSSNTYLTTLTSEFGDSVDKMADAIINNSYSKSQEYKADESGLEILGNTGYNKNALLTVVENLESAGKSTSGGLFSNHPDLADRIGEVKSDLDIEAAGAATPDQELRSKRFKAALAGIA
jgi:beta-barrel assembly-enhancing protease